ncbi:unnamed protein product [Adineta ricciae]|uniref:Uncharacterized protein n=1 Tax=Adineta ricciae TaxID=249248 RepID=A0A814E2H8_ADIRI|nr:unnamed protein product [Adineta ricciae]
MLRELFYRNPTKMKVVIALGVVAGALLISTIVLAALLGNAKKSTSTTTATNDELCLTPYCVKAANYILESIDETVNPCENFFEFACGTWLKNNRIPDDAGSQDTFNVLRNQLDNDIVDILTLPLPTGMTNIQCINNTRVLYDSCIDEATIEATGVNTLLSAINTEFGGWPILQNSAWNASTYNLSVLLQKLREYNQNIIYSFGTSIDDQNSTVYFIRVSQSDLALEQRARYDNETSVTIAYRQFIYDLASLLTNVTNTTQLQQDVVDIFEFEKNISRHHLTPAEQRAKQNETVRTTIGNLSQTFTTDFEFTNYLRQVYLSAGVTLNDNDIVSISDLDFLRNASKIVSQSQIRVIQNYVIWRFVMNRVSDLPKRYRLTREAFDREFRGTSSQRARSIVCGSFVNNNMGFAVSKVYVARYFDENAKNQSSEMISNIRNAFIDMVQSSTWMDVDSKKKAIEKAKAIDEQIGYPKYVGDSNTTELERMYSTYTFNGSYISNVLKLLQIKSRESLQRLRETVDRKAWGTSPPTVVNAFYTPSRNQISFPAGILQTPFFHKDAPKYLNYGGIGAVIGHEITHGFDDNGRQFDKDGNRVLWWSQATIDKFIELKTCIVDQYSNYTVAQINKTVNGSQTQGENIADNGGIKEAFNAYKKLSLTTNDINLPGLKKYTSEQLFFIWFARIRCYAEYNDYVAYSYRNWAKTNGNVDRRLPGLTKYSAEQLFFINYGQVWCSKMTNANALNRVLTGVHSPGQFRVIGPTSNFEEFATVFSCKPGQNNSPVNRCSVW